MTLQVEHLTAGAARHQALLLARRSFDDYIAADYGPVGTATFHAFLDDESATAQLQMYGAFAGGQLVGMLALRGAHIALFFTAVGRCQSGIGRQLFGVVCRQTGLRRFTVHASPCGLAAYHRLGFVATGSEQCTDGMRYTPMCWSAPVRSYSS